MVPWLERPAIDIDLDRPANRLLEGVPEEAVAAARQLLGAVLREIPRRARSPARRGNHSQAPPPSPHFL